MMNLGNALLGEVPIFKVIIVGDSGSGKTNIVTRYVQDKFSEDEDATIAVQFFRKKVAIGSDSLWLHIWDTGEAITSVYYRGASGCILVFDLCNRKSFQNVKRWYQKVYENAGETLFVLVGNKSDLSNKSSKRDVIKRREINQLTEELDCKYFECSAKTANNVQFLFEYLNTQLMNGNRLLHNNPSTSTSSLSHHKMHEQDSDDEDLLEDMGGGGGGIDGDISSSSSSPTTFLSSREGGTKGGRRPKNVSMVMDIGEDNETYKKSFFCWDS